MIKAGDIQMGYIDSGFQVSRKGTIDLVTEADVAVETMFRKMIAERFPDHTILAEEFGEDAATRGASHCWVFDPIDGTNNYAHGLPIFCSSLALEIEGRGEIGAIYDPTRKELFVAERGGGAFLNGRPIHVSDAPVLVESMLVTGFPYDVHKRIPEIVGLFGEFVGRARAVQTSRIGRARPLLHRVRDEWTASGSRTSSPGTSPPAPSSSRRPVGESPISPANRLPPGAISSWPQTAKSTTRC